jgi:RND family efflux transporter MFP subunit
MKRYVGLLIALTLALVIGYRHLPPAMKASIVNRVASDAQIPVKAMQVERKSTPQVVHWTGTLEIVKSANVVSRIAGQISEVRSKAGDVVSGGQVLATVRSIELLQRLEKTSAALEAAKMDLQEKEAQLATAEKEFTQALSLHNRDLIAGKDLTEAEAATTAARARQALAQTIVKERQAMLDQTRYLLTFSKLLAPSSGVVVSRLVESGAYVQASTPAFIVGLLDPLKVEINISEGDADFVREAMTAEIRVDSLPDRVFEGKVAFDPRLTTTQPAVAEIRLPNPDRVLKPGMGVRIRLMRSNQLDDALGTTSP